MESRLCPVQTRALAPPRTLALAALLDATQRGSWEGRCHVQGAKSKESVAAKGEV